MKKPLMTLNDLLLAKAVKVAVMDSRCSLYEPNSTLQPKADLASTGFYFFVNSATGEVYSRYFVGRQRSKTGVENVVSKIRNRRSNTAEMILSTDKDFDIYFVSNDKIKVLTNGHGKGKIALAFTRKYSYDFQNLEELNRILNDNFKFKAQKY